MQPSETESATQEQVLTFLTVEHSALQNARSATIFDSNGRATLYLTALSSTVVALAFIGQVSEMGESFYLFSAAILPPLLFIGVATFERVLQSAVEDTIYGRGINRIRHYYLEIAPHAKPYFIQEAHDDLQTVVQNMGAGQGDYNPFMTTAGMITVLNSVLAAIGGAMLLHKLATLSLIWAIVGGVIVFGIVLQLHLRYQAKQWMGVDKRYPTLFPPVKAQGE
jgi:hypothetical protein